MISYNTINEKFKLHSKTHIVRFSTDTPQARSIGGGGGQTHYSYIYR